jgi:hypothetical protein
MENVPELLEMFSAGDPEAWSSAVVACERLDQPGCWAALDASLNGRDALDQLTARMAEWRKERLEAQDLFAAAGTLVTLALNTPPGPDRARMCGTSSRSSFGWLWQAAWRFRDRSGPACRRSEARSSQGI